MTANQQLPPDVLKAHARAKILESRREVTARFNVAHDKIAKDLEQAPCIANLALYRETRKWLVMALSVEVAAINNMNEFRSEFLPQIDECRLTLQMLGRDTIDVDKKIGDCNKAKEETISKINDHVEMINNQSSAAAFLLRMDGFEDANEYQEKISEVTDQLAKTMKANDEWLELTCKHEAELATEIKALKQCSTYIKTYIELFDKKRSDLLK